MKKAVPSLFLIPGTQESTTSEHEGLILAMITVIWTDEVIIRVTEV